MENLENVTPCDFYHSLSKKEKSMFLDYMHLTYNLRPSTLVRKLSKSSNYSLSILEIKAIIETINNGLWLK